MPPSFFLFLSIFYLSINLITTDNPKVKSPANPNNHFTCQIYECCAIFFLGLRYLVDFWSSNKHAMVLILLAQVVFVGFFGTETGPLQGSCAAEILCCRGCVYVIWPYGSKQLSVIICAINLLTSVGSLYSQSKDTLIQEVVHST